MLSHLDRSPIYEVDAATAHVSGIFGKRRCGGKGRWGVGSGSVARGKADAADAAKAGTRKPDIARIRALVWVVRLHRVRMLRDLDLDNSRRSQLRLIREVR